MRNTVLNRKITAGIVSLAVLALPLFASAQVGIPCTGGANDPCTFDHLIILANNIIKFLMFSVAVPLAAIGFMWMGAKMVLLPNKESAKTEAKEGAMLIIQGFGIMLVAYILIKTLLFAFLTDDTAGFVKFMFQ